MTSSTASPASLRAAESVSTPTGPAAVMLGDQSREVAAVGPVEAEIVDAEPGQRAGRRSSRVTRPSPSTTAKSTTRRSRRPAIRGVPRARRAISQAPSASARRPSAARRARRSARARPPRRIRAGSGCRSGRAAAWSGAPSRVVAPTRVKGGGRSARSAPPGPRRSRGRAGNPRARDRGSPRPRVEAVDLVDEQHVARLEVGEDRGEVARLGEHRPRGHAEADAELARDDLRERGLAEAGRAVEERVVHRLSRGGGRSR
jgi:hypothetical protein